MVPRISLAGRIAIEVAGAVADERTLLGRRVRLTVAMLVLERHRPLSPDELAQELWPQARPETWDAALRNTVESVRGFVTASGLAPSEALRGDDGSYQLDLPGDVVVDLERAIADVDAAAEALAIDDVTRAAAAAAAARSVLVRPLLPGVNSPWVAERRRRLAAHLSRALELLAEARLRLGLPAYATAAAEAAVELDPSRVAGHQLLVRSLEARGDSAAALHAAQWRRRLVDERDVAVSPELDRLHREQLFTEASTRVTFDRGPPPEPARVAAPTTPPLRAPPYLGLRTFGEQDAPRFFGRSADVVRALERLADGRFLALVGPSGSGASSLARAGLVAALRRGALPDADTWDVRVVRPGRHPGDVLSRELDEQPRAVDGHGRNVIVVDQLEEVFTLCRDEGERHAFLDELIELATGTVRGATVVVVLRADFYTRVSDHPRLADLVSTHQYLVTAVDEVGLAEAIEAPAAFAGLRLEPGLTEVVLRDVGRRAAALPFLQHALVEVWRRRVAATLTIAAYRAAGGVEGALAQRAETLYGRMTDEEQATARRLLLRLVGSVDGVADVRRRVAFDDLATPAERDRIEHVLDTLTRARLVTTGDGEAVRYVELAHEALIRGWPRLRGWVDEDRADQLVHGHLSAAATEWRRLGRDARLLYRGARLIEAAAWAERDPGASNEVERSFLAASLAAEAADRRRGLRRLQVAILALAVALVAALTFAVTTLARADPLPADAEAGAAGEVRRSSTSHVVHSSSERREGEHVGDHTALERARLVVHGDRAELRIEDGHLTIRKLAGVLPSSVTVDVARVRGTQLQPPKGSTRGWLHVRVVGGSPAPPGELAASGDPYTLPLTARGVGGAWRVARLVERHVKARGMPGEEAPTQGRWSSSVSLTTTPPPPRPSTDATATPVRLAASPTVATAPPPPPPPPPPPGAPSRSAAADFVAELRTLADLRDRGALTDDEFERAKARILG